MAEQLGLYINPDTLRFMYYFQDAEGRYRYKCGELRRRDDYDFDLNSCHLASGIIADIDQAIYSARTINGFQKEDGKQGLLYSTEYAYFLSKIDPKFNSRTITNSGDQRLLDWLTST